MFIKTWHRGVVAALAAAAVTLLVSCSGSEGTSGGGTEGSWTSIEPAQLNHMLQNEDTFLVNVHVPYEGEIPGTDAFIPYDQITSHIGELPRRPSWALASPGSPSWPVAASAAALGDSSMAPSTEASASGS